MPNKTCSQIATVIRGRERYTWGLKIFSVGKLYLSVEIPEVGEQHERSVLQPTPYSLAQGPSGADPN